jgi:aryl-alcohol dehydrogenase-like predicted oxidoreductase
MSALYGPADEQESIRTIHRALDLGINLLDTADSYGEGHNERLIGRALSKRRDGTLVATKFGRTPHSKDGSTLCGRPDYVIQACTASLVRLGMEHIDIYYLHRVDPNVPIEETVGAMKQLVEEGKVRHLGLSEASADSIRRASSVHPIFALQSEWSLWTRDLESGVLPLVRQLGIGIVPYSPLGRGFLTGTVTSFENLSEGDYRRTSPRFQGQNLQSNLEIVDAVRTIANRYAATPAQIALAWLLHHGDDVVPIPGTKSIERLEENVGSVDLVLDGNDLDELERLTRPEVWAGDRYADHNERDVNTPEYKSSPREARDD